MLFNLGGIFYLAKRSFNRSFLSLAGPRPSLIFSNRRNIRQIRTDGSEYKEAVAKLRNAVSLDFDIKTSTIYWTEQDLRKIQRARIQANAAPKIDDVMKNGLEDHSYIAVDWVGRNIYWAKQGKRHISLSKYEVQTLIGRFLSWRSIMTLENSSVEIYFFVKESMDM